MTTSAAFLVLASFLACAVEMVEALTIVLAVGVTRGWRSALLGVVIPACPYQYWCRFSAVASANRRGCPDSLCHMLRHDGVAKIRIDCQRCTISAGNAALERPSGVFPNRSRRDRVAAATRRPHVVADAGRGHRAGAARGGSCLARLVAHGVRTSRAHPGRLTLDGGPQPGADPQRWQQWVEERTHTTLLRMILPLVFLIFPAMYLIIRGLAIPQVSPRQDLLGLV